MLEDMRRLCCLKMLFKRVKPQSKRIFNNFGSSGKEFLKCIDKLLKAWYKQIPHKLNMSCILIGEVYFFLLVKMYAPLRMLCLFRARLRFNLCGSNGSYVFRYAASVAYLLFFINPKEKTMKSHFKKLRYLFFRYLRIPWVSLRQDKKKTFTTRKRYVLQSLRCHLKRGHTHIR